VNYEPNTLGGNMPNQVPPSQGGFASYPERISGAKVRQRSQTFGDHYGQARLFWNSMTAIEREQITHALQFELSKVGTRDIQLRMLDHLYQINDVLGAQVALALGIPPRTTHPTVPPPGTVDSPTQAAVLADATSVTSASGGLQQAKGLSEVTGQPLTPKGRQVAILAADGVDATQVSTMMAALTRAGARGVVVGTHLGALGHGVDASMTLGNTDSVLFDAVYVPGGAASIKTLLQKGDALFFIDEAYKHAKPIAASAEGVQLLSASAIGRVLGEAVAGAGVEQGQTAVQSLTAVGRVTGLALAGAALNKYGVVTGQATDLGTFVEQVLAAIAQHRFWSRPGLDQVPA
jgi:catalase